MPEETGKANLLLRIIAKTIDFIIITILIRLVPQVGFLSGLIYLLIGDGLLDGRSLGKKVMRLKVISVRAQNSGTFRDSIIRNTPLAIGLLFWRVPLIGWFLLIAVLALEFLLMLGNKEGMRLGDDLAGTKVLEG